MKRALIGGLVAAVVIGGTWGGVQFLLVKVAWKISLQLLPYRRERFAPSIRAALLQSRNFGWSRSSILSRRGAARHCIRSRSTIWDWPRRKFPDVSCGRSVGLRHSLRWRRRRPKRDLRGQLSTRSWR